MISTFNGFLIAPVRFQYGCSPSLINQNAEPQQLVTVARIWFLYRYRFGAGRAVDSQRAAGAVSSMNSSTAFTTCRWLPSSLWAFSSRASRRWQQKWRWGWRNRLRHHDYLVKLTSISSMCWPVVCINWSWCW
ncbi:hypothetical protein ACNKHR_13050 [Shigella flexneri]